MAGVIQLHGEDVSRVEPLFAAYDYDRSLIGGVLEDKNPGHVFCEWGANPTAAILFHPVDYAYLAGDARAIRIETLVVDAPRAASLEISDFELFAPRQTTWIAALRAAFGSRLERDTYEYFAFARARESWVRDWQSRLPDGIEVVAMDEDLAQRAQQDRNLQVTTGQTWGGYDRFVESGFGFIALIDGEPVAAISTFSLGHGEAEIDIATHPDYRRRGLATLLGCAYVCHCLDRDLTPSWTTNYGNLGSAATARRLGFVDRFALPCFTITSA